MVSGEYLRKLVLVSFITAITGSGAQADSTEPLAKWNAKTAYQPRQETIKSTVEVKPNRDLSARNEWVFSAPPRGDTAEEQAMYQPLVEFLTRVTGHKVVYENSDNWLSYSKEMTFGHYDLVFDGPHFNGWREDKLRHTPLVKLPDEFVFVVVARQNDPQIKDLKSLAGRLVCAHAPPNLGTLTLLSRFDNPSRQPSIVEIHGWEAGYKGMMEGKCVATVLPLKNFKKFEGNRHEARILYQHRPLPNQAISAGPAIPPDVQVKIANALVSDEGRRITAKLLDAYAAKSFVPATREEYAGLGDLLKDTLYYQ